MVPLALSLDARSATPLHRQLYQEIRSAVLAGRLAVGARLPSTRALAADLGISRNTVAGAFDQLLAEGYIASRAGSGTYVAKELPEKSLCAPRGKPQPGGERAAAPELSRRGRLLAATPVAPVVYDYVAARAFRPGIPALDEFPRDLWARIACAPLSPVEDRPVQLRRGGRIRSLCAAPSRNICARRAACAAIGNR